MKSKLLFEIIITNQCNKRCEYCKLDFKDNVISDFYINNFIKFVENNIYDIDILKINFFWWEPLLKKDIIINIVDKLSIYKNIYFSIWTNWILLDELFLNFCLENNITIYLTIDTDSWKLIFENKYLKEYLNIIKINFVINPHSINNTYFIWTSIINYWFKNINIMPVFSTIQWDLESFKKLNWFIKHINLLDLKDIKISKYSYFNWVSIDKQFILDTNWNIYQDLDSLLWIQKQDNNLDIKLSEKIDKDSFLFNVNNDFLLKDLLNKYSIDSILNLVFEIPKSKGLILDYKIIDKILK